MKISAHDKRRRLLDAMLDDAAAARALLQSIMNDSDKDMSLRIRAANSILDRAGFSHSHRGVDASPRSLADMSRLELEKEIKTARGLLEKAEKDSDSIPDVLL